MNIKRTPFDAPLSCFGLELDLSNAQCKACPYQIRCRRTMGDRAGKTTLNKLRWQLIPKEFGIDVTMASADDPDRHRLDRVYDECYRIIYKRGAPDHAMRFEKDILENVTEAKCSVRVYILACMIGFNRRNEALAEEDPDAISKPFTAHELKGATALTRCKQWRETCRRSYGTFSTSALDTLVKGELIPREFTNRMLNSEIIAGTNIISHKLRCNGSGYDTLFRLRECDLDEIWLAIEPEYMRRVMEWRKTQKDVPVSIRRHRQNVMLTHGEMKKNKRYVLGAFEARQHIMPQAVTEVLNHYGYSPSDFEMKAEPVHDALRFWVVLGRAVCQMELLNQFKGINSYYDER